MSKDPIDLNKIEDIRRLFNDKDFVELFNKYNANGWNESQTRLNEKFKMGAKISSVYGYDGYMTFSLMTLPAAFLKNIFNAINAYKAKEGSPELIQINGKGGYTQTMRLYGSYGSFMYSVIQSFLDYRYIKVDLDSEMGCIFLARRILMLLGETFSLIGAQLGYQATDQKIKIDDYKEKFNPADNGPHLSKLNRSSHGENPM